jgi:CheY-like chemotaxis protein
MPYSIQWNAPMKKNRVLLVDDNDDIRAAFQEGLEGRGFEVVPAARVNEALNLISTQDFDVLLSDLHMPDAGDGLTVVSAMRHRHPDAVTLLVQSDYPVMQDAMASILLQDHEILTRPFSLAQIADVIQKKLSNPKARTTMNKERVSAILDRDVDSTVRNWLSLMERNEELAAIPLSLLERTGHLPLVLADLIRRLRLPADTRAVVSSSAREHGVLRQKQGYTIAMVVEESRILQVSIFGTLQNNLGTVDFSTVLLDVITIADEVDSQLKQAVLGFTAPSPATAASASGSVS